MTQAEAERTAAAAIADIVARIGHDSFGTEPLAELRRLDLKQVSPGAPTLYRLLARYVPDGLLDGSGMKEWTLLVHLLALAAPKRHHGAEPLGHALFAAGYSEGRMTRLLEARAEQFPLILPRVVRFLVAKNKRINPFELARLVLRRGGDPERLRIAREYYRAEAKQPDAA